MSPSCFPVHEEMEYARINYCSSSSSDKRRRRWRNLLRRLVRDGKSSIYGSSKPLSFHYDAVSYSQNFDEGCHHEESGHYRRVFHQDVRWGRPFGWCSFQVPASRTDLKPTGARLFLFLTLLNKIMVIYEETGAFQVPREALRKAMVWAFSPF
ncbi:hypothetical protein PTKIN_Ptkin08bG0132100 [Pterospermum kingtungense]